MISKIKLYSTLIIFLYFILILSPNITADNEWKNTIINEESKISNIKNNLILLKEKYENNSSNQINKIEYRALLIGINEYGGQANLPYSINEINSFKKTLIEGGNWIESNIQMLTDSRANINNIFYAINWLSENADDNDVSIFYFSGHGGRNLTNEAIVSYDGGISDIELDEKLDTVKGRVIVILDSCFSGGFIKDLKGNKRIIMASCGEDNLTYQYSGFKSGIFGYFVNLSLQKITKNAEFTFLFAYIGTVYYSKKLSEEYGEDYSIYPKFSDGTIGITRIINHHNFTKTLIYDLLLKIKSKIVDNNGLSIWKM